MSFFGVVAILGVVVLGPMWMLAEPWSQPGPGLERKGEREIGKKEGNKGGGQKGENVKG